MITRVIFLCFMLCLAGCATGTAAKWYAPATWFSRAPAAAAEKAIAKEQQAAVKVDATEDRATHAAHVEIAKTQLALTAAQSSRAVEVARRTNANALALLDQFDALTAEEQTAARTLVADLLSENAERAAVAEKAQAASETELTKLSRALTAAEAERETARGATATAEAKLRAAFDRENALANELRAAVALRWILAGVAVLASAAYLYVRYALGGLPVAFSKGLADLRAKGVIPPAHEPNAFDSYLNRSEQAAIARHAV